MSKNYRVCPKGVSEYNRKIYALVSLENQRKMRNLMYSRDQYMKQLFMEGLSINDEVREVAVNFTDRDRLVSLIESHFVISWPRIVSDKRNRVLTYARRLVCKLLVERGMNPVAVAEFVHRDRTTVLFNVNAFKDQYDFDKEFRLLAVDFYTMLDQNNIYLPETIKAMCKLPEMN